MTENHSRPSTNSPDSFHYKICVRPRVVPLLVRLIEVKNYSQQISSLILSSNQEPYTRLTKRNVAKCDATWQPAERKIRRLTNALVSR